MLGPTLKQRRADVSWLLGWGLLETTSTHCICISRMVQRSQQLEVIETTLGGRFMLAGRQVQQETWIDDGLMLAHRLSHRPTLPTVQCVTSV